MEHGPFDAISRCVFLTETWKDLPFVGVLKLQRSAAKIQTEDFEMKNGNELSILGVCQHF